MTEGQWLSSTDPQQMLRQFTDAVGTENRLPISARKLRLFACACIRQVWHLLDDKRSRNAVEVAESFADGQVGVTELRRTWPEVETSVAAFVTWPDAWYCTQETSAWFSRNGWIRDQMQADLMREVVGNTFACMPAVPKDGDVLAIALRIYEERDFEAMPILRDALIDAGCDDEAVLAHCLESGHVRGCWLIDMIIGKS